MNLVKLANGKLFQQLPIAPRPEAVRLSPADIDALHAAGRKTIEKYIVSQHRAADALSVKFDWATRTITLRGIAPDRITRDKIVRCCKTVVGVSGVNDQLTIGAA
jgi:osmotically-inducible protein OsmY